MKIQKLAKQYRAISKEMRAEAENYNYFRAPSGRLIQKRHL